MLSLKAIHSAHYFHDLFTRPLAIVNASTINGFMLELSSPGNIHPLHFYYFPEYRLCVLIVASKVIICVGSSNRGNLHAGDPALDSFSARWAA